MDVDMAPVLASGNVGSLSFFNDLLLGLFFSPQSQTDRPG